MSRIKELEREIIRHKVLYYQGHPEISDEAYDSLESELKVLDKNNSILSLVGTSTQTSNKIKHDKKMLSLEKTYDEEEFFKWMNGQQIIIMPKIDGMSCSLIYKNGKLNCAKTRGDGEYGEDIIEKVRWISDIPINVDFDCEIRGEIYCKMDNFLNLVEEMKKIDLEPPSSQRNIVAGLVGRKDHVELARYLSFTAFDIQTNEGEVKFEHSKLEKIKKLKFNIPVINIISSKEELIEEIESIKSVMNDGSILLDGLVGVIDDLKLQQEMGETSHHPKFKLAFKFKGETKISTINEINWNVSRNGILTPVASIAPIVLSGAMVSNVTLHNFGIVKEFNLKSGDKIEVVRSGEVIPKFLSVKESTSGDFVYPMECPSCKNITKVESIRLVCSNENCVARKKESILNFIQKIGIDDLSEKRLEEMMKKGLVKKIQDLYMLSKEDLLTLEKTKEKLAEKLMANINKSKSTTLPKLLGSIGIIGGAINRCTKVINAGFNTINKIQNITKEELLAIDGFAEKSSEDFLRSLREKHDLLDDLIELGFKIETISNSGKLKGNSFVITGEMSIKRNEMENLIRENGGVASGSVTKKTNYLITNDQDPSSSKHKKAVDFGIKIISEEDFLKMLERE